MSQRSSNLARVFPVAGHADVLESAKVSLVLVGLKPSGVHAILNIVDHVVEVM